MCSHLFLRRRFVFQIVDYELLETRLVFFLSFFLERIVRHGPVFTQEPSDSVFPLTAEDNKIFINCKAKGSPEPHYRYDCSSSKSEILLNI